MIGLTIDFDVLRMVVLTPVSIVLLYLILQIKKDGLSCWTLLEPMKESSNAAQAKQQDSPQPKL